MHLPKPRLPCLRLSGQVPAAGNVQKR